MSYYSIHLKQIQKIDIGTEMDVFTNPQLQQRLQFQRLVRVIIP